MPDTLPSCPFGADHVAGRLYMGGFCGPSRWLLDTFDVIVCCARELQPAGGVYGQMPVIRAPLDDDGPLSLADLRVLRRAGKQVRWALDVGRKVLVTCHMGRNRSGVVSALALMLPRGIGNRPWFYGDTPACLRSAEAIRLVRRARGANALSNLYFFDFLRRSEGVCAQHPDQLRYRAL